MGFHVGAVDQDLTVGLDPIAQAQHRVVQELGRDADVTDPELLLDQFAELELASHRLEVEGSIAEDQLALQQIPDRAPGLLGRPDADPIPCFVGRSEERQALDVIPVGVGQQDVGLEGPEFSGLQVASQGEKTRPGVQDQQRPVGSADLDAQGVAPVAHGTRPRRGNRAASAPEPDLHEGVPPRAWTDLALTGAASGAEERLTGSAGGYCPPGPRRLDAAPPFGSGDAGSPRSRWSNSNPPPNRSRPP